VTTNFVRADHNILPVSGQILRNHVRAAAVAKKRGKTLPASQLTAVATPAPRRTDGKAKNPRKAESDRDPADSAC